MPPDCIGFRWVAATPLNRQRSRGRRVSLGWRGGGRARRRHCHPTTHSLPMHDTTPTGGRLILYPNSSARTAKRAVPSPMGEHVLVLGPEQGPTTLPRYNDDATSGL